MIKENYSKPKVMKNAVRKIVEAELTANQIQQIFQGAQKIEKAKNINPTMIDKVKNTNSSNSSVNDTMKTKNNAGIEAFGTTTPVQESVDLTESQIFLLIGNIVERQRRIDEGIMDTLKSAAGKATNWAKTKGQNLTTKITADKLLQAWKKSGSPTDSDDVAKVMISAGVPQETVTNLMKNFVQGPSAGTNTNVWQGADRSIPAIQRKQQGQSFAATPNAQTQTQTPTPNAQTQTPTPSNLPLRYYGAGNAPGSNKTVKPTMQSQQRQAALDAANAARMAPTTTTTPQTSAPQGTTYDPSKAAANRLSKGQAAQQQALKQMAATRQANSPASQQNAAIKAAAAAAMAKPGFQQTAADKLAIRQAAALNNTIQMPRNTTPTTKVAEGEFAGHYATGVAGQWRNKGPKANSPAKAGDLVGGMEEGMSAEDKILLDKMLTIARLR